MNFEDKMSALEEYLRLLESGELSLEASLEVYEKGAALVRELDKQLTESAGRLEKITAEGAMEPFAEELL